MSPVKVNVFTKNFLSRQLKCICGLAPQVVAALLAAVGRDAAAPLITQQDIVEGCKKQMRGALQMLDFEERVLPTVRKTRASLVS